MNYFVTGATGFIGRYLVKSLLEHHDAQVYVLVRTSSRAKLDELEHWWQGADKVGKVIVVDGDLGQRCLGLSSIDRQRLRGTIDHFFHLGALYDLEAGTERNELINVAGTRHALDLAHDLQARCFHYCSSIAAAGLYDGVFTEEMFEQAARLEHPYFRTKHDAEALVRRETDIPWRIYRPGIVLGHSQTGHITKIDGPYYFFKALQVLRRNWPAWLPLVGFEGGYINAVPVDFVVAAMLHLAHLNGHDRECFHLTDPQLRRAGELLNLFAHAGHAPMMQLRLDSQLLHLIPAEISNAVRNCTPLHQALDQLCADFHLPKAALEFINYPTRFDCERTQRLLQHSGIRVPPLEDYAWRLWDYWERHLDPDLFVDRSLSGIVGGKRVLITGASSGIGKATALKVAAAGAQVVLVARSAEKLRVTQDEIAAGGGHAEIHSCDLTDAAASQQLIELLASTGGGIDILINNAGRSIRRSIDLSYSRFHDFERLMNLNYYAAVRLTLGLLPQMVARGNGHVIMISSIGVLSNAPHFAGYVASKAALEAFARCAAPEFRDRGVHFTVINMPLVRTPMIAPTRAYDHLRTTSPEEAALLVVEAIIHRPARLATRLGVLAQLLQLLAPNLSDVFMNWSYHMFPDSAAAKGECTEAAPTKEAIAFADLLRGFHW